MDQHSPDRALLACLAEAGEVLLAVVGRAPHARGLVEDLDRLGVQFGTPFDRLVEAAGGGDVRAYEHWCALLMDVWTTSMAFRFVMRVRFAPSPTGALHIGGARAALYNWLLAHGPGEDGDGGVGGRGSFVLRIEDTDRERSTEENVAQILDALTWLGLDWDEGPISQVGNTPRHQEALAQLLADGHAYHSNATGDDVKAYKQQHGADRGFRGEPESSGAVRLHVPDEGHTSFEDLVRGEVSFPNASMDDPVIARADGSVLYNFAVAVDDLDSRITHVVRGEDHISNTPKQLLVFEALGADAAQVRAPAAAARPRRQEALEAPRRGVRPGVA